MLKRNANLACLRCDFFGGYYFFDFLTHSERLGFLSLSVKACWRNHYPSIKAKPTCQHRVRLIILLPHLNVSMATPRETELGIWFQLAKHKLYLMLCSPPFPGMDDSWLLLVFLNEKRVHSFEYCSIIATVFISVWKCLCTPERYKSHDTVAKVYEFKAQHTHT